VEHVVDALEGAGAFHGLNVCGLLNDADEALVAGGAGAVGTGIDVGDVVADGAEAQAFLEAAHGFGEGRGIIVRGAENVEGERWALLVPTPGSFFNSSMSRAMGSA